MANSVLNQQNATAEVQWQPKDLVRGLVWKIAIATWLLMAVGSATRVMNAGLACPDWPLCYGQLIPAAQMNLQVFLEWFHRLDAAAIGLSAIALLGLSLCVLGGLTVTQLLRFDIVTAHLGTALLFFCALLVIGFMLTPYEATGNTGKLAWISAIAVLLVYLQSLLGALVGSRWALHQCLGSSELCEVMNSHIIGIVPATAATLVVTIMAWRQPALSSNLRKLGNLASVCLIAQLVLGLATFRLHLQVEPLTVAHQAVGAALLGTLVAFSVLAWRDRVLST